VKPGTVTVGYLDDHHWSACFGLSLRNLYLHDQAKSHRIMRKGMPPELRKVAGTGGIPEGRNELARAFLDTTDSEWLFMVDTDMGFAPDTVDQLVFSASRYARGRWWVGCASLSGGSRRGRSMRSGSAWCRRCMT
jgi:hypothetical protein